MEKHKADKERGRISASFATGAIALAFLIVGYQSAIFIHRAAVTAIVSQSEHPDTVYIVESSPDTHGLEGHKRSPVRKTHGTAPNPRNKAHSSEPTKKDKARDSTAAPAKSYRKGSPHSELATAVKEKYSPRRVESFRFDPNTVSLEDLVRLGFTQRQAQAIDNYRIKGGRFSRKSDFAKSFVVSDSVYRRLESYIDIPLLDINAADSAAFDALPGIGPYFAAKMVEYREKLGGYSYPEQLMDIYHFDEEKYKNLSDLIRVGEAGGYPLWTLSEETLKAHPYIGGRAAHGIILYREHHPKEKWTIEGLAAAGVIDEENAAKLARCRIVAP